MKIDAAGMEFAELNRRIRESEEDVIVENCLGQRFIGSGLSQRKIDIYGIPGNALGAYLDSARLTVFGNAQDAVGDTMNEGEIVIHGSAGDAVGYAMRGGRILIHGNAGYRVGIHMKAYADKLPVIVIGGVCGSFLGEYQAGGQIVVLGIDATTPLIGRFCGTGMHGGKIFLRCDSIQRALPPQVHADDAHDEDIAQIEPDIRAYCKQFGGSPEALLASHFFVLTPNSSNPYRQLYVRN